ncbi:MAG: hypothetical protein ACREJC_06580 [Tepidisphaeraceae bacterium]
MYRVRNSLLIALMLTPTLGGLPVLARPLSAGDVAIIGFNMDDPDELAFVALASIPAGTVISFTDNGWKSPEELFRTGEGVSNFTVPAGGIAAGVVTSAPIGSMSFSATGDQIFAFEGSIDGGTGALTGTLLFGLNDDGASVWQATAADTNTSALPAALGSSGAAVALTEIDNAIFNTAALASGTKAQWLVAITNPANWSGSDATRQTMPTGPISVTVVPEPMGVGIFLAAAACAILRSRRRIGA